MGTTNRLGIDILATNKTAAAFAQAQKGLAGIQSNLQQLKFLMAGFVSGNILEGMVRSFVSVSKQSAPVKSAIDNLAKAWTGFAMKVGDAGLDQALINFANRMGAMVLGTDSLATSIGRFMAGAVNAMAMTFEGVGRAIAFVYDNMEILGRLIGSFALALFARQVLGAAMGFYFFAKSVREAGVIMTAFRAISRANLMVFLALAAGVAYATDSIDTLKSGIDSIWQTVKEVFPQIAETGKSMAQDLGFDFDAFSGSLMDAEVYLRKLSSIEMPQLETTAGGAAKQLKQLGSSAQGVGPAFVSATSSLEDMGDTLQSIGDTMSQGMSTAFRSIIDGSATAQEAFSSMLDDMMVNVTQTLASAAMKQLIGLLQGGLASGIAPSQQGGGFLASLLSSFAGFHAKGGTLGAGKWGIAGEAGPEIVTGPARITPMQTGRAGSIVIRNNVVNNSSANVQTRAQQGADGSINIETLVEDKMIDTAGSGRFARVMGGRFGARVMPRRV